MKKVKRNINRKYYLLSFLVAGLVLVFFAVQAGNNENVRGWLWGGSNTNVGWISTNNLSSGAGGSINYGLSVPSSNGKVTGYAWSSNIGWIDFNPQDHCGSVYQAQSCISPDGNNNRGGVRRSGNNLVGWARIVGIAQESKIGNSGGWDGWINMYNVSIDSSGKMDGYAWSNELGWIYFGKSKTNPTVTHYLNICHSCSSTDTPLSYNQSMQLGGSSRLKACLTNVSNSCYGSDVTALSAWKDDDTTDGAIQINKSGNFVTVLAIDEGNEDLKATYNDNGNSLSDTINFTVTDNRTLVICENGCNSGTRISILNLEKGDSKDLSACYNVSASCNSGGDVTNLTNWSDDNSPNDAVYLDDTSNPVQLTAVHKGQEHVTANYKNKESAITVNVSEPDQNIHDWREVTP